MSSDRTSIPLRARRSGFTLTELLVASMTFIIAGVALLTAATQGMRQIGENQARLVATTAVTRQMEALRSLTLAQLAQIAALPSPPTFSNGLGALPGATGTIYVCNFNPTTSACDGGGVPTILRVTVAVSLGSRVYSTVGLFM